MASAGIPLVTKDRPEPSERIGGGRVSFTLVAWLSIVIAMVCAAGIALDEVRRPQKMAVMNVVWPVTALYFSVLALWGCWRLGRSSGKGTLQAGTMHHHAHAANQSGTQSGKGLDRGPTPAQVAVGTSHCGAGCTIADLACEFWIAGSGITLLGSRFRAEGSK